MTKQNTIRIFDEKKIRGIGNSGKGRWFFPVMNVIAVWVFMGCCAGCSKDGSSYSLPAAPDYSREEMWFDVPDNVHAGVDVFYVTPTCVWDWQDADSVTYHYMNVNDPGQREAVDNSNRLAFALFGRDCRFYSPYYRQITMNSWMVDPAETERRYRLAHRDVVDAFRYYMTHYNEGRPFILAGHSQGAKAVIELLKHTVSSRQHEKMVAAYVFGFNISREEVEAFPLLQPARDSVDCGVVICYNSVSNPAAVSPLFEDNAVCINPLNWRTDTVHASAERHIGAVFFDAHGQADTLRRCLGARIDDRTCTLIVEGLDDDAYYIPSIGELFPKGNFHVQELNLYFLNIQENIARRIAAFGVK